MDAAALFISIISALATGGATIMAWQSRADSLEAQREARAAEASALEISRDSATALSDANRIALQHFEVLREDASRRERAKWAGRLLRWGNIKLAKASTGATRSVFADDPTFASLNEQRVGLVDIRADELHAAMVTEVNDMVAATTGGVLPVHAMHRMTAWSVVVDEWIADPGTSNAAELSVRRAEVERAIAASAASE